MTDAPMLLELERLRKRVERERCARQEAELLAERGTRQLYERQRELELLNAIADAANGAAFLETALQVTLDQLCAYTAWPVGHAYLVKEDSALILVPTTVWHLDQPEQFASFRQLTEVTELRRGEGLPGRVLESGSATWIVDVTQDENFPRARHARDVGLRAAFAFPVLVGTTVMAVLEFFSCEPAESDKTLLKIAAQAGTQLSRIFERKRAAVELQKVHKEFLGVSRQAGMAEVATAVLHNVGNVLNSMNISASLAQDVLRRSKTASLVRTAWLLHEHNVDLAAFLTDDPKGRLVPGFIIKLAHLLKAEHQELVKELSLLVKNVEHIKEIVAVQQTYASVVGVVEYVKVSELVEDALRMNIGALARHEVETIREFADLPPILVEKHKVLQILVNLIRNAKYACDQSGRSDKRLIMQSAISDGRVKISVIDNGVGIPAENLTRIFGHGFTTKKDGHGFGLHSGANAAKEMGGRLTVHSDGPGCGATFTLELPIVISS